MWFNERSSQDNVTAKLFCTHCPTDTRHFLGLQVNGRSGHRSLCGTTGLPADQLLQALWFALLAHSTH